MDKVGGMFKEEWRSSGQRKFNPNLKTDLIYLRKQGLSTLAFINHVQSGIDAF